MNERRYELNGKRVWVTGHRGMVGSAIVRRLARETCEVLRAPRDQVDLTRQDQTEAWMAEARPQVVIMAAAKVGGILANSKYPAEFIYENLSIEANLIHTAHRLGVEKLVFLGSSCIYPRLAPQPIAEDALLTGPLEPTNEWYAVAKIAGIKLCQAYRRQYGSDFIAVMPTNLYGPGDSYDLDNSHVVPALMLKAHLAKEAGAPALDVWGSGRPRREFLHVEDLADAVVHLTAAYSDPEPINVGYGEDVSIRELAETICDVVGFRGELRFDASKPDGTPRKLLSSERVAATGWSPKIGLRDGLTWTYAGLLNDLTVPDGQTRRSDDGADS